MVLHNTGLAGLRHPGSWQSRDMHRIFERIGHDVTIIGGGAMGSSTAYHLKSDPNFAGKVTVIERDPTYARASSALSASSIRQQFSTPLNIHLSRYGIGFLRRASELLGVDLGLKEPGYLFLASP